MTRRLTLALIAVLVLTGCEQSEDPVAPGAAPMAQGAQRAAAGPATASAEDGITVVGHGRVSGEPDTLRATVGVHVVRPDVDEAFTVASTAAERVMTALQEHGVAEDDIQTREFSVRPEREGRPDQAPVVTGYVVRNLVEATVRDIDQTGDILAAVAAAAGDDARVEGLSFSLADNDEQLRGARERAFRDARQKAEHYAELAAATLGELIAITEISSDVPPPVPLPERAADAAAGAPPVMPGQQQVDVRIQATWTLE